MEEDIILDKALDEEYLSRPAFDVEYNVSERGIFVYNDNTFFISVSPPVHVTIEQFKSSYKKLIAARNANPNKLKLKGTTNYMKEMKTLYPDYMEGFKIIARNFNEIKGIVFLIKERGLHIGCVDDQLLKHVSSLSQEIQMTNYRNTGYSKFIEKCQKLQTILSRKEREDDRYLSTTIHL